MASDRPPGELIRNSQPTNILSNYLLLPPISIALGAIGKIVRGQWEVWDSSNPINSTEQLTSV